MAALYNNVAGLRNVVALCRLVDRIETRAPSLPGMACFYGPSGWGKTTSAAYAANRHDCHVVQMKSLWKTRKFLQATAVELGLKDAGTNADLLDKVSERLARSGRTLIIDEADVLIKSKMIEVVRDIYESSGTGVILVGEETLPQELRRWERVHGRMLDWVGAQAGTAQDLEQLIPIYAPNIEIAADLKADILRAAGPSIRRMCVNLAAVSERARTLGGATICKADMGSAAFFTGEAPAPRRIA